MNIILATATTSTGSIVLDVILTIVAIIAGFYAVITTTKFNIMDNIPRLIKEAQAISELAGPDKMQWVINQLREYIPKIFSIIFTEDILKQMAQNIYDYMKGYRKNYEESKNSNIEKKE